MIDLKRAKLEEREKKNGAKKMKSIRNGRHATSAECRVIAPAHIHHTRAHVLHTHTRHVNVRVFIHSLEVEEK